MTINIKSIISELKSLKFIDKNDRFKDNSIEVIFGKNQQKLSREALETLKKAKITEKEVIFDFAMPRNIYEEVKKALENIGGKWQKKGGKNSDGSPKGSIVFERFNPKIMVNYIIENGSMPLKNPTDFFPTPKKVVKEMIDFVGFNPEYLDSNQTILEPSAGTGGIADVLREQYPDIKIDLIEYLYVNAKLLESKGYNVKQADFLNYDTSQKYRYVFMNPPFDGTKYIDHIYKAYEMLETPGDLVAIIPNTLYRTDKKTTDFYSFVECNGFFEYLDDNSFAESGTKVKTLMVRLEKNYYSKKQKNEKYYGFKNFDCWKVIVENENDSDLSKEFNGIYAKNYSLIDKRQTKEFYAEIEKFIIYSNTYFREKGFLRCLDSDDMEYLKEYYLYECFERGFEKDKMPNFSKFVKEENYTQNRENVIDDYIMNRKLVSKFLGKDLLSGYAEDENDYELIFRTYYDHYHKNQFIDEVFLRKGKYYYYLYLGTPHRFSEFSEDKVRKHFTETPTDFLNFEYNLDQIGTHKWHRSKKRLEILYDKNTYFSSLRVFNFTNSLTNRLKKLGYENMYIPVVQVPKSFLLQQSEELSKKDMKLVSVIVDFEIKDISKFYKENYLDDFYFDKKKYNKYQTGKFPASNILALPRKQIKPTEKSKYSEFGFYKNKHNEWIFCGTNLKDYSKHWAKHDLVVVYFRDKEPRKYDLFYKFKGHLFAKNYKGEIITLDEYFSYRNNVNIEFGKAKAYHYDGYPKPDYVNKAFEYCLKEARKMFNLKNISLIIKELKSLKIK